MADGRSNTSVLLSQSFITPMHMPLRPRIPLPRIPASSRTLSFTAPRTMPLYCAFMPDQPGALEQRLSVREEHLAEAAKDKAMGKSGAHNCRPFGLD